MVWPGSAAHSQYYSKVERDGFVLTKFVSETEVPSGQTFQYHITFSIPAGSSSVTIVDQLPPTVEYVSSSYYVNQTCAPGTAITPTVTLPVGTPYGGTYQMNITPASCGAVGSFTIVVRFPCGITCDSTRAVNSACMFYTTREGKRSEICTKGLLTLARAQSTWTVHKQVQNMAYQGGTCPNAVNDSVIKYCITVSKAPGTTGQLNLVNGSVSDVIPAGAYVKPGSSCIAATPPGSVVPTTLTWNVGNMSACSYYNSLTCCFEVVYPRALFPIGSQVTNTAVLTGLLGDFTTQPIGACGRVSQRSTVCSEFRAITRGNISKWAVTNGQPGCAGSYFIRVCNNGNVPLTGILATDTLPANLTYGAPIVALPAGWGTSFVPGPGPRVFNLTSGGGSLPVGGCVTVEIPFTINVGTPPMIIQNCVTLYVTGTTATTTCYNFAVATPQPIACVAKMVCNKQSSYSPGDIFTYRLRIQNIGGQNLSGAIITDALDPNLEYLGNVRGYTSSNYNIPCGQPNTWGPITATYPIGGPNTVQFAFPTIPFNCNATGGCGQNGTTVPFYFIEFDVKVSDSSALGTIYNFFRMSGGTLPGTVVSNTENIVVSANTSYWLEKEVKASPGGEYATSTNASAGSNVEYKLTMHIPNATPQLAALRNVSFIDLLPRDDSPAPPNDDKYIMTCFSRGSMFDVTYQGPYTSTSNPYPTDIHENTYIQYPDIRSWWPTGAPQYLFNAGCSTNGPSVWNGPIAPNDKNFGFYFGPWAFTYNSLQPAWVSYVAKVSDSAVVDDVACNTFAASASVRYIVNGSILLDIPIAEAESQDACITVIPDGGNCLCDSAYFEPFTIPGLSVDYRTVHVINRHGTPISWIDIEYYDCATGTLITDPTQPVVGGGTKEIRSGAPVLTLPIGAFVPPYRRVPTTGNFPSWSGSNMQDEVLFNIGFNFFGTIPPTWCMKLIIHHEGGDSCEWNMPPWTPQPPSDATGAVVVPHSSRDKVYMLMVEPNLKNFPADAIGFMTFTTSNDEDKIIGGSGGPLNSSDKLDENSIVKSFVQSQEQALFRVDINPEKMSPVRVFITTRSEDKPVLIVSLFDHNGGILSSDKVEAGATVDNITSVNEVGPGADGIMINSVVPNPVSASFTCNYTLGTGEVARLELFNMLGQSIAVLADEFQSAGLHQLNYNVAGLAEGMYYLRLSTRSGTVSTVVNIAH